MSNMSYCRFENTASDLRDCEDHLLDRLNSRHETDARIDLVETCYRILEALGFTIEEEECEIVEKINEACEQNPDAAEEGEERDS